MQSVSNDVNMCKSHYNSALGLILIDPDFFYYHFRADGNVFKTHGGFSIFPPTRKAYPESVDKAVQH